MKKIVYLFLLVFITAGAASAGITPPGELEYKNIKTDLGGMVVDAETGKPIKNVSISVMTSGKKEKVANTDKDGVYSCDNFKPGSYKLVFEKTGYKKVTKDKVLIKPDGSLTVNITMDAVEAYDMHSNILRLGSF